MRTLEELKQQIAEHLDETLIIELLNINSFELVERFEDKIEENFDKLIEELYDEEAGEN